MQSWLSRLVVIASLAIGGIAATPAVARAEPPAGDSAMLVAGTAFEVAGVFALVASAPMAVDAATCGAECDANDIPLWPVLLGGGIAIAAGIPLLVAGSTDDETTGGERDATRPTLEIVAAPTAFAIRASF